MRIAFLLTFLSAALPAGAGAAFLEGVVVEQRSGKPLARASVKLEWTGATSGSLSAFADTAGHFSFPSLRPGAYLLSAQKRGYAAAKYGQREWNFPGTPIVLEGEAGFVAQVKLRKLAVITGQIVDENHLGMPDFPVHAYRAKGRLRLVAGATTDDRGVYRLAGLEPGKYYVRTGARELEDRRGLLPTYFGPSSKKDEARTVTVRLEDELANVDIEPLAGRLGSLGGVYAGPAPATIMLITDSGNREAQVAPGASFQFDQLAPGYYELLSEITYQGKPLAAYAKVYVSRDAEVANLEMRPAPQIEARCLARGRQLDSRAVSVFIRRLASNTDNPRRIACDQPVPVTPGDWEIAALAPSEYYLASVSNTRVMDGALVTSLRAGEERSVMLQFASGAGIVSGTVRTSDGQPAIGAPVYLNPLDDELRGRIGGVRGVRSDQDGKFRFDGVPPGRYEGSATFEILDPGEADWTPGRGKSVEVSESGEVKVELVLADPAN